MEFHIRLNKPEDVQRFCSIAEAFDFDIDVRYRHYVLNAKSYLGLINADYKQPLVMFAHVNGNIMSNYVMLLEAFKDFLVEEGA